MSFTRSIIKILKNVMNCILLHTYSYMLIKTCVKKVLIQDGILNTLVDNFSLFHRRNVMRKLSCSKVAGNVCILGWIHCYCKEILLREIIFNSVHLEKKPAIQLSFTSLSIMVISNSWSEANHLVILTFLTTLFIKNEIVGWPLCTKFW